MSRTKITPGLKRLRLSFKPTFIIVLTLLLITLIAGCSSPAATTQSPMASSPATTTQPTISTSSPTSSPAPTSTAAPTTTTLAPKPEGEVIVGLQGFGNENFLPWLDPFMSNMDNLVYDMLIYWDHVNHKFFPGLAESWDVSPDGLALTYHLRKGVEFQDGWGELTSEDVKYNFEKHASPKSVGKTAATRRIASMDTPDPYTLVVHFKDPYPTFYVDLSMANSGTCQGFVCKKYVESVGEDEAGLQPIGTGPYKLVDSQPGNYYKFEAKDSHWRLVPEFKYLTARNITETATVVAALKNKEIDLSQVPAQQMADLKASGVTVEDSPLGGNIIMVALGGMIVPEDKRYDPAADNKDPWTDIRVRKAMAISIDREAICQAIYAGYADPAAVPLLTKGIEKYQYPYDPEAAKQLLKEAGYPNGFTFKVISYTHPSSAESPRIIEALASYWLQIGLDPQITVIDYNTYYTKNIAQCKTAGDISLNAIGTIADMLAKAEMFLKPNAVSPVYEDEGSAALWNNNQRLTFEERDALVNKLNQYFYDNYGPIPVVRSGYCFGWNSDKVSPWPHFDGFMPLYLEYVRHAKPINTYSLFRPWPDR